MAEEVGFDEATEKGIAPFREFMLSQTREADLLMFSSMAGSEGYASQDDIPLSVLMPSL